MGGRGKGDRQAGRREAEEGAGGSDGRRVAQGPHPPPFSNQGNHTGERETGRLGGREAGEGAGSSGRRVAQGPHPLPFSNQVIRQGKEAGRRRGRGAEGDRGSGGRRVARGPPR